MRGAIVRIGAALALICAIGGHLVGGFGGGRSMIARADGQITLDPSSGTPGSPVTVSGGPGSFRAGSSFPIVFTDANGSTTTALGPVLINGDGSFSKVVLIPTQASGGKATITVEGDIPLSARFQVLPSLVVSPVSTSIGSVVTLVGNGYAPLAPVSFSMNSAPLPPNAPVTTNLLGSFSAGVTIPPNAPLGQVSVTAFDGTVASLQAHAIMTVVAPTATPTVTPSPTLSATMTAIPTATATATAGTGTTVYFAEGYTGLATTNGKASFSEVLNILNANPTIAQVVITYYVQGASAPVLVVRQVPPNSIQREWVNADVGPDRLVGAAVSSSQRVAVTRTITRVSAGGSRLDGSTTSAAQAPALTWGFPEGYTGITFQEYLTLLNPSTVPAIVRIVLAPQASSAAGARTLIELVPAQGRVTANIRTLNQGSGAQSVGMLVSSTTPIVAERVEYFGDGAGSGKFGSTVSMGINGPAGELRVAYGSSGGLALDAQGRWQAAGDQAYVTLLNPATSGAPVQVTARFSNAGGQVVGQPVVTSVAAGTRQTIAVNAALGTVPVRPFSVSLSATGPIEAESAQYFGGSPNTGQHPGIALPAVSGAAADVFLTDLGNQLIDNTPVLRSMYLYNPGGVAIQVTATYIGSSGGALAVVYGVPAGGIAVVNVNQDTQSRIPPGPMGAELRLTGGSGGFVAVGVGQTTDGLSTTEETGSVAY